MDYISQLSKIYINDGVDKFGLIYSSIQRIELNNGFISTLEITNKITIKSDWFIEREQADRDCARKAVFEIRRIEYDIQNSFKTRIKQKIYKYKQLSKEIKLKFQIWLFKKLYYYIILAFIIMVLLSPLWFYKNGYSLGKSSGNRCIIRKTANLENIFQEKTDYLYADDKFLILDKAKVLPNNNNSDNSFFEVVLTKNVVLYNANIENKQYPTYCLPKLMGVGVRLIGEIGSGGEYSIVFLTYERDGLPKRYVSKSVSESAFTTNVNFTKFNVFSKYGFHVHKERYISIIQTNSFIDWYFGVLSIYKDYLITFLIDLFTDSNKEVDKIVGYDKFQLIKDQTKSEF